MKIKPLNYVLAFFIFAFLGFGLEYFMSLILDIPTYLYGQSLFLIFETKLPFLPIYGFGGVIILMLTKYLIDKKLNLLLIGFINGAILTIVELIGGFICIGLFGYNLWDYSSHLLNYQGIISLPVFIFWIIIGYIFALIYYKTYNIYLEQ